MQAVVRFAVAVAFLLGTDVALAQQGDAKAGKATYDKQCATCHGADGTAKEPIAKMLKVEIKHLGSKEIQAKSDADLRKTIAQGMGKMKAVKGLADQDVGNVVAHLRTLAQR